MPRAYGNSLILPRLAYIFKQRRKPRGGEGRHSSASLWADTLVCSYRAGGACIEEGEACSGCHRDGVGM